MNEQSHRADEPREDNAGSQALGPLGRQEFESPLHDIVRESAPRMFAVVQELGDCEDGAVAAWGLAFEDRADVVSVNGVSRLSARTPGSALRFFSGGSRTRARLIWPEGLS